MIKLNMQSISDITVGNINEELRQEREEKGLELKFSVPEETVSIFLKKMGKKRTMPILEKNDIHSDIVGVVTQEDIAKFMSPPRDKIPLETLEDSGFPMKKLGDHVLNVSSKKIKEVFKDDDSSDPLINKKVLNDGCLKKEEKLVEAIAKFDPRNNNRSRYRTFLIIENNKLEGVLSYYDILKIIKDNKANFAKFFEAKCSTVHQSQVTTVPKNTKFSDLHVSLEYINFTHFPIVKDEGSHETIGIMDTTTIYAIQHKLFEDYIGDMTIEKSINKLSTDMYIDRNASVDELFSKFVDSPLRPTAIMTGTMSGDTFLLEGIISYIDIFKKFLNHIEAHRVEK
ncbi:MAG: CBS domain-containing protein [Bacteroidia bacterium]